jgi:hypothetical protein
MPTGLARRAARVQVDKKSEPTRVGAAAGRRDRIERLVQFDATRCEYA